jgi:hypothetical protein
MFNHLKFDIMEKEVKIQIPEGYEIDREQSTFERIVLKKKGLTYKDVATRLFSGTWGWYIEDDGDITNTQFCSSTRICDPNNATSKKQLEQILALNKLLNVAEYLNNMESTTSSRLGEMKYHIFYAIPTGKLDACIQTSTVMCSPTFNSAALALQAIEILGEAEVKKAFGIFE